MKTAVIVARPNQNHHSTWGEAFKKGLLRHGGWDVQFSIDYRPCDLLLMWGVRRVEMMETQKRNGGEVCVLERGYVEDRFQWTSVSFGGKLNGRATFRGPFEDRSRWDKYFAPLMQPWRPAGTDTPTALIMGQVGGDSAVRNVDIDAWYERARNALRAQGYNVLFRAHPKEMSPKLPAAPLADDLGKADVVVTWNSNSGVDAVLAGVPTIAMDRGSMAWDVTGHDLRSEAICRPDRSAWAHALAWKQWRICELEAGECWSAIKGDL